MGYWTGARWGGCGNGGLLALVPELPGGPPMVLSALLALWRAQRGRLGQRIMRYLLDHLDGLRRWWTAALVLPFWEWCRVHWAGFWWSSPFVWICLFWAADWCLGSARALHDGWSHPEQPERGWRAARAARSVLKLGVWLAVLGVAWGIRDSGIPYGTVPAGCLEAGVILTEAGSVVAHLAELSGSPTLRFLATKIRRQTGADTDGPGKPGPSH